MRALFPRVLARALPPFATAQTVSADLTPALSADVPAELVMVLRAADGAPVLCLVIEVQLAREERKRWSWPLFVAAARNRYRCPCALFVVAPDATVARWAARAITLGPGGVLRPIVIGAAAIPRIVDPDIARRQPKLAILSALAHGKKSYEVTRAAVAALATFVDDDRHRLYTTLVLTAVGATMRAKLERDMKLERFPELADLENRLLARGRMQGEARVEARREARGRAEAILHVLRARRLDVSDAVALRVRSCTDLAMLDAWLERAALCGAAEDIFRDA